MMLLQRLLLLLYQLDVAIPSTHWLVTEQGKVEAQPDSIFMIRQPNDFVAFVHQEQRFIDMNDLHEKLSEFRGRLDDNTSLDIPDVESLLSKDDPDCLYAGRSLTQFDLYLSTMVPLPRLSSFKIVPIDSNTKLREPLCSNMELINLSIPEVDNFPRILERGSMVMQEEAGLMPVLLEDGKVRLSQYGHSVAILLSKEKSSWDSYNLATLYWRMKGNAYEAVECIRRAIHFGSRSTKSISLVSLGNVLHQALKTEEAAQALENAVSADPSNIVAHYTLGNVYAVLMQYNKSIEHFDTAVSLSGDDLEWVRKRGAAVKCHKKLEMALEAQHTRLQHTLDELKTYQTQHSTWSNMNSKLHSVQAPLESRVSSRDSYETFKLLTEGVRFRPQGCYENIANGQNVLECVTIHYTSSKKPVHSVFRRTHHVPTNQDPNDILQMYPDAKNADNTDTEQTDRSKPSKKKRYPKLGNYNEFTNYNKASWPGEDECKTYVTRYPEWTQLPSVYLPPDNKGFDLKKMINDDIGLGPGTPHPLPWYPPQCDTDQFDQLELPPKYANMPGFFTTPTKEKMPDESIKPRFLVSFGRIDMTENIAELGARIRTAMDRGSWPAWLLHILAGSYWRILGNTGNSVTCYGLALAQVPTQYKDLVLTNLGSLLYKLGHVDAALKLLQESLAICDTEPETHFFLANLLAAKGNMTGSIEHYRAALRLEPDYPGGVDQLRIPSCYVKYHLASDKDGHCSAQGNCDGSGGGKYKEELQLSLLVLAVLSSQEANAISEGNASFTSEQVADAIQKMEYDKLVGLIEDLNANIDSKLLATRLQDADPEKLVQFLSDSGEKMKTNMHAYIELTDLKSSPPEEWIQDDEDL